MPSRTHAVASIIVRTLALGCIAASLGACGGGASPEVSPLAGRGDLQPIAQAGALVDKVKGLLAARQSSPASLTVPVPVANTASSTQASASPAFSTTTRQEDAVDEDDLLKTDGRSLYSIRPSALAPGVAEVQVHRRAADGSLSALQTLSLPAAPTAGVNRGQDIGHGLLWSTAAGRVAAVRRNVGFGGGECPAGSVCTLAFAPSTHDTTLDLMNVGADGTLTTPTQVQIQGELVASRMVGSTLVIVTRHRPTLAAERLGTQAERDAALASLRASDILPSVRVNGAAATPLVTETQCYLQADNGSLALEVSTITSVDMTGTGFVSRSRCFLGGTEALYMSPEHVYLATARWPQPTQDAAGRWVYPVQAQLGTDIHKFSIAGADIAYRASGAVSGHLGWQRERNAYRMSEHRGDLRVVTFTGSMGWGAPVDVGSGVAPSPATLSVLREDASSQRLQTLATLPNAQRPAPIGLPGEQVYAVRFVGDRAYVVTFRQVDPLYVLDLSDAADPRQVGELKITGFSESLYPLPGGLLLGVGKDADDRGLVLGVKVALFDVADPARPGLLDARTFGVRGSGTGLDYSSHGISLFTQGDVTRVGLPMALRLTDDFAAATEHGLHRLEVNARARSLSVLSPVGVARTMAAHALLPTDRSVHIDGQVYYFSGGALRGFAW